MNFQTTIDIPKANFEISHQSQLMLFGSCFSKNIGNNMIENKFNVILNPFGILYNPFSIGKAIERIVQNKPLSEKETAFRDGLYHSFLHHGAFSHADKSVFEENITRELNKAHQFIAQTDTFIFTFGTAYLYRLKTSGEIIGNCHKFPAEIFTRTRISADEIVSKWEILLSNLWEENAHRKFIFTVSPIRHWKDGAHENQLSKSTLLLAIDQLVHKFPQNAYYFPSYEIMMDELRDYRFYTEDMLHPSNIAVNYIWQRFLETFLSKETEKTISTWQNFRKALNHRPINPKNDKYRTFLSQTLLKLEQFQAQNPFIDCSEEHHLLTLLHENEI